MRIYHSVNAVRLVKKCTHLPQRWGKSKPCDHGAADPVFVGHPDPYP